MRMIACRAIMAVMVMVRVMRMVVMAVRVMNRVLDMLAARPARCAEEGEEHEPPAVEAGEQRREHADQERRRARSASRIMPTPVMASVPIVIAQKVSGIFLRSPP
jgi:energy-converting hydrogenase Eha subunit A